MRRIVRFGGLATGLTGLLGLVMWAARPAPPIVPAWDEDYDTKPQTPSEPDANTPTYDLTARPPELIAPGTVIGQTAPAGWSHLVMKSLPRVRAGEGAAFPLLTRAETVRMASWMFTAFTADVIADPSTGRHRLRATGLGLGTAIEGRDTVVTAATTRQFNASPGVFGNEILTKAYDIQAKAVMPIGGPSLGVLDTPVWFRCGGDNRLVRYRYALLVSPVTGRLDVLMWSLGAEGICADLTQILRIAPNTIDKPELIVDRRKVNALGIPSDDAFAVDRFPPGRRLRFPPELRALATQTRFTAEQAHRLETSLRALPEE